MTIQTENLHIVTLRPLPEPAALAAALPRDEAISRTVADSRAAIRAILSGQDERLLVIAGPCSIHDTKAALDYAARLAELRRALGDRLEIVMRVYFEKPRTTVGWKGLINDPHLDGSDRIEDGLPMARRLLLDINRMGLPAATEFLDPILPQYLADLIAWGAIGARTTESQIHRQLASGLSCPVGFKNGTDGGVQVALDAIRSAARPHSFPAITAEGRAAIATTTGNDACHVVLRGGHDGPNYSTAHVAQVAEAARRAGIDPGIVIDASHANSSKDPARQIEVSADVAAQIRGGEHRIRGLMLESNLVAGRQDLVPGAPPVYGQSITDGCLGWEESRTLLIDLAEAAATRLRRAA
ncbi:3-deoxy-7-phosphoheptulonate synthase (plasmid) [Paracoccus kondratievae]|uniref:Phospho-2-dehydro-3-deoxyheptonate aldolase n=1 Tax=Paracoccus kondratievae TaxID=135740 RepID=A0AAD3NYY4_9RHOB|nr:MULTISPECIES: 3-deoxy-7-phosphoheptulonate synthase [Paracoccus]QFQ89789.1 3-deoxy-7-phosphoheptulonate synthase [Paracoccus kondratievae]GLK64512.1 phospho-2-dehydro-3-deoxyheptonate aldolase [Paracoccus kondratievae]SMG20340.1 3-deoxy-D-arabinoheptulosonate-7-phosphate synthase [Paracoccus sp. J56]